MLISEAYREQNKLLHAEGAYGFKGHSYAAQVIGLRAALGPATVLDYGCGQHTLAKSLPFPIKEYDPCIPGYDAPPEPADLVVCTDVLEHIEYECIDSVLNDLKRLTRKLGFFTIDTRPARKTLPDGRNAHLIQKPAHWWFKQLYRRWAVVQLNDILFDSKTEPGVVKSLGLVATVRDARAVEARQQVGSGW